MPKLDHIGQSAIYVSLRDMEILYQMPNVPMMGQFRAEASLTICHLLLQAQEVPLHYLHSLFSREYILNTRTGTTMQT